MNNELEVRPVLLPAPKYGPLYQGVNGWRYDPNNAGYYHLYLVSDREIKEGDWFITSNGELHRGKSQYEFYKQIWNIYKVEASTDSSLGLPGIPKSYIEWYVKNQGKSDRLYIKLINEDLVELYRPNPTSPRIGEVIILPREEDEKLQAKVLQSQKEEFKRFSSVISNGYTRKEVIDILQKYRKSLDEVYRFMGQLDAQEWLDLNYPG